MSLLGNLQLDLHLLEAAREAGVRPGEAEVRANELLDELRKGRPGHHPLFLTHDFEWSGRNFALWFGLEFYWRNLNITWHPDIIQSSAELFAYGTESIRRAQIRQGNFGGSLPPPDKKHKVVSTLGSASLKPGKYHISVRARTMAFGFLNQLFYVAGAAGLSVDGKQVWKHAFVPQLGMQEGTIVHLIRIK